ncbi:hypothetical protein HanHA300_Chr02g0066861 [Helianthus annuus]|nr:hypothetical protein HanHA300_Chr02g0066861 [Helianthus annuus]
MEVLPPLAEDGKSHSDVLLFNRWTYDDVQFIASVTVVEDYVLFS